MSTTPPSGGPPAEPAPPRRAHAVATELLRAMILEVRAAAARVAASSRRRPAARAEGGPSAEEQDEEAIHDFRVALRRLRTLLRIVRSLYGKKRVATIAADLKAYADVSGAVRDEEVLRETLGGLSLDPEVAAILAAWVERRRRQERTHRGAVVRLLRERRSAAPSAGGAPPRSRSLEPGRDPRSLERALRRLEKRLAKPPRDDVGAAELARAALDRARADVRAHASASVEDGLAMHLLRIRFKRLRYTAELLGGFTEDAAATAKGAARLQKRLGELHDLDEALSRLSRAWGLPAPAREAVLAALREKRARVADRARTDLAAELAAWDRPAAPAPPADAAAAVTAGASAAPAEQEDLTRRVGSPPGGAA